MIHKGVNPERKIMKFRYAKVIFISIKIINSSYLIKQISVPQQFNNTHKTEESELMYDLIHLIHS